MKFVPGMLVFKSDNIYKVSKRNNIAEQYRTGARFINIAYVQYYRYLSLKVA